MRLFLAIPMSETVIGELSAVSSRYRNATDGLRWSAPETWHITLQFLGETSPETYACLLEKLREIRSPAVPVRVEGLGFFDRAGVFFADVHVTPELATLQQQVISATAHCGFAPEDRPFHPHVTLARIKGQARGRALKDLKARVQTQPRFSPFRAQEFLLYQAFLGSGGSRYEVRERFPLAKP